MRTVTGNKTLDQVIAAYTLQHPGYEFIEFLAVQKISDEGEQIDLTEEWWNSYNGMIRLIFKKKDDVQSIHVPRTVKWKDSG